MARRRLVRDEPDLPDEAVLVRSLFDSETGDRALDRSTLVADATVNFDVFGYYGLSLWAVSEHWPLDRVLDEKARRARRVALYTAGEFRSQGLDIVLSGKAPHVDAVAGGSADRQPAALVRVTGTSADDLVDRFLQATYTLRHNRLFRPELD